MIRFLDLTVGDEERRQYYEAIDGILKTGKYINSPEVENFEKECAAYCGISHAIGCGSGTSALSLALRCLRIGIGDEVIVPALSFVATANAIVATGATPKFVDIGHDLLIDVEEVGMAITQRTKAIMPVHFTGNVCDVEGLAKYRIPIIEDAAPAFGASRNGKKVGTLGTLGCFSMNPMKVLGASGEAGVVVTSLENFAERLRNLRYHGIHSDMCWDVSLNERMDAIQAAILSIKLRTLDEKRKRRQEIADRYTIRLVDIVELPDQYPNVEHAWYVYTILCDKRDKLEKHLINNGIECKIYHPKLIPHHWCHGWVSGNHPIGDELVGEILCLPMHDKLTNDEVDKVSDTIVEFYS
jgi:dTDP-4-amino-4,6-dideoxygalactose transaminase